MKRYITKILKVLIPLMFTVNLHKNIDVKFTLTFSISKWSENTHLNISYLETNYKFLS